MFFQINDFEELQPPISENYTCYEVDAWEFDFWTTGVSVILFGTCGIFGNLFSIPVLYRLAAKSGFNKLLLGLSKLCPAVCVLGLAVLVYLVFRVKSGDLWSSYVLNFENIYLKSF